MGTAEWLKPYTSDVMKKLPSEGCSNILVIAPGFSVDCLETIEEIDEENKEYFLESGGKKFTYINCLNDSDQHIKFLNAFIETKSFIMELNKDIESQKKVGKSMV